MAVQHNESDPSDDLNDMTNRFVNELESEVIPKFVAGVETLKQLRDRTAHKEQDLAVLSTRLQQEVAFFLDLDSADMAAERMDAMVQQEEQELEEAKREVEKAKEAKVATKKELERVNQELDRLKQESERLDLKATQLQELKREEVNRVVGRMMRSKFRRDRDSHCVSLVMDNEHRIERVIIVPEKENAPQSETRNSFWDKLSKNYKL